MTKQDFEMLVVEIEARVKAGFETMKAGAAAEMAALHAKMDALHEKVETAMSTPAPVSAVMAQPAMADSQSNMPPGETHDDHSDHA